MAKDKKEVSTIKVTLVKSTIGRIEAHKATVKGLGLRRIRHTVEVQDTPAIRGMIELLAANADIHGFHHYGLEHPQQGILHVVAPELAKIGK